MFNDTFLAIENSAIGTAMRESSVLFPATEAIHVLALTFVVGSIAAIDLRLLYVSGRQFAVTKLSAELLPWTWGAFVIAAITGALLFTSSATDYAENVFLQVKLLLIAAAGINMGIFHFVTWQRVHEWDLGCPPPAGAKLAGALSLAFWVLVVTAGRWIGFV